MPSLLYLFNKFGIKIQIRYRIYDENKFTFLVLRGIDVNWTQYANMNETQREQRLEANIRQLAMFDEKLSKPIGRVKRQPQYGSAKTVGLVSELI